MVPGDRRNRGAGRVVLASRIASNHQAERGFAFWVLHDPWGNEFCVLQPIFPQFLADNSRGTTDQQTTGHRDDGSFRWPATGSRFPDTLAPASAYAVLGSGFAT
jgi:hypothetical protein